MRRYLYPAAVAGVTGVVLGAFGAHVLRQILLDRGTAAVWQTGVLYHLIHTVALLAAGLFIASQSTASRHTTWLGRACFCWAAGIFLFSGSLYWLAVGGPWWLGPVTPLGGVALIAGWACLLLTPKTAASSP